MAAIAGDSLFNVSQSFFSPDILQKISKGINQPVEQTKVALKSAIPTLLMGIVNKGSTKEGAEALVDIANHQTATADVATEPTEINEGNAVVNKIFGSNLNGIVAKLGASTGMNSGSITKMLGMAAPMVMGAISSKIKTEHMSPTALMGFLGQQKTSLMALMPAGIPGLGAVSSAIPNVLPKTSDKSSVWPKIVLGALVVAGLFWWYDSTRNNTLQTQQSMTAKLPTMPTTGVARADVQAVSSLAAFLSNASDGEVKRFKFESLTFNTGTATVSTGATREIEQVVAAMKANPTSTARIEGYTDNIGLSANNIELSKKRAIAVKDELVFRGIRSSRIETAGFGAAEPVAKNDTAAGRAANRRIEFVIKR